MTVTPKKLNELFSEVQQVQSQVERTMNKRVSDPANNSLTIEPIGTADAKKVMREMTEA